MNQPCPLHLGEISLKSQVWETAALAETWLEPETEREVLASGLVLFDRRQTTV